MNVSIKSWHVQEVPYDGKSIGSDEGKSEPCCRLAALGVFFRDEVGKFIGDELPTCITISLLISREFPTGIPSKRGVRGADLGVDIPNARLAMIPGVLGTALFLGVPLVVEGVPGSNKGCLGGAFGIDCSADPSSCMSTSESGKFIGEDIVPQHFGG